MWLHHLKIAFRNFRKYKTQNIISIIGLAVGFVCFAFSALWIRYEMSYDSFHPKASRIYRVHIAPFKWDPGAANTLEISNCPYPLAEFLKTNYPEIEDAGAIFKTVRSIDKHEFSILYADRSVANIFDMKLPEEFFLQGRSDRPVAVTPDLNSEEIEELLKERFRWDIHSTFPRWQPNTNIKFNMVIPLKTNMQEQMLNNWNNMYQTATQAVPLLIRAFEIYILVHDNVDMRTLEKKLDKMVIPELANPLSVVITPLTKLRYNDPSGQTQSAVDLKFSHIQIFAIAGLLVILSSLFNHLTLFVSRMRMRLRELALRKVSGASDWQIATTLYFDFIMVILLSLVVGFSAATLLLPAFKGYSSIEINDISIYSNLTIYAVLLIVCGFIAGGIPVLFFRKQILNASIKGAGSPGSRNTFRKGSLLIQLIISLGMMFCALVFIKQIRFLHNTDLGISRDNIVTVSTNYFPLLLPYADEIKQIPGVVDAIPISRGTLSPNHSGSFPHSFTDSLGNTVEYNLFILMADNRFFKFFGVDIIEGEPFGNESNGQFLLNETAMKEIGKYERQKNDGLIGVIRDFHFFPTERARATKVHYPWDGYPDRWFGAVAYKYQEGMREQTEKAVSEWIHNALSDRISALPSTATFQVMFSHIEDIFEENFKSERALLTLISVMTLACILIAIFGVYSLASLTCQQRRKEIAIRKINGAEVLDIMNIFFKEYLVLLALAALLAFPAGYIIMKRWMEIYVKQTSMDAWLYVAIFLIVFVVIVFSIFTMVWRAANRNPAEVVKSE